MKFLKYTIIIKRLKQNAHQLIKKRKSNESPETDERILRFTAAAKRKRQRLDKKIQHATSPIVSFLLN